MLITFNKYKPVVDEVVKYYIHHHQVIRIEQATDMNQTIIFYILPFTEEESFFIADEYIDDVAKKINDMEMLMKKYERDEK